MKRILNIITVILILVTLLFLYGSLSKLFNLPKLPIFGTEKRYESPWIIQNIKSLFELYTQEYYTEILEDSGVIKIQGGRDKRLVFIVKGRVKAGLNLEKLEIVENDDENGTIHLKLTSPYVLETITNPDDFEIVRLKGKWGNDQVKKWMMQAHEKIKSFAMEKGILERAEKYARKLIENFLQTSLEYKTVTLDIIKNEELKKIEESIKEKEANMRAALGQHTSNIAELNNTLEATQEQLKSQQLTMGNEPEIKKTQMVINELEMQKKEVEAKISEIEEDSYFKKPEELTHAEVAELKISTDNDGKIIGIQTLNEVDAKHEKWLKYQIEMIKNGVYFEEGELPKSSTFNITLHRKIWQDDTGTPPTE